MECLSTLAKANQDKVKVCLMLRRGLEPSGQIWYATTGMSRWGTALKVVGMGWYIGICIVLGVWGGLWLDNKLNTTPILVIGGLILGIIIAFYGVYRMILPNISNKRSKGKS